MKIRSIAAAIATLIAIQGNATEISTAEEFVSALAADPAGSYTLTQNIDLTGSGFTTLESFSGQLNGNSHTLSGMGATTFCNTFAGEISALTLDGTVNNANTVYTKSEKGVFCVDSKGGKFTDVVIKGYTIRHSDEGSGNGKSIGLFAAYAYDGTQFVRCTTDASCVSSSNSKAHNDVGGFVGSIKIDNPQGVIVLFEDCVNNAVVIGGSGYNTTLGVGGMVGVTVKGGSADIPTVQFIRCTNNGAVSCGAKMNAGGFVGYFNGNKTSETLKGVFSHCVNNASVTATGENGSIGGFIGQGNNGASATFDGCVNRGIVDAASRNYVGGFLGGATADDAVCTIAPYEFVNCANYGNVSGVTAGGLVGEFKAPSWNGKSTYIFKNVANYGTISGTTVAGIVGVQSGGASTTSITFDNCWALSLPIRGACDKLASETNMQSADADGYNPETSCAALNEIVDATAGYMPWVIGPTGHPELAIASSVSPETDIPVVFCDSDCSILKVDRVAKGAAATAPADPTSATGTFLGWDKPFDNITANTFIYALYGTASRTITFDSAGGSACDPITAAIGANIVLPTPTREGWTFVCWSENFALRMPSTMPDYDLTLKALWLKNEAPPLERLSTMLWRVKPADSSSISTIAAAVFGEVAESRPDFASLIGLYSSWRKSSAGDLLAEDYDCIVRGTNGENDGRALTIAWMTNRFELGVANTTVNCGSDNQCMYGIFQERGTDNYFAVVTFKVSTSFTSFAKHTKESVPALLSNIWAQYPTTTIIVCADYASIVNFDDYESECGGTPQGAIDYVTSQTGLSLVSGGEDLKLVLMKSPYDQLACAVTSVDSVENEDAANEVGYVTRFNLGKRKGLTLIFR